LTLSGVAVEKLVAPKFAKIKSRQDALQTTFSVFLDIFYPPIFGCFEENGVFQQPQAVTLIENWPTRVNECYGDFSPIDKPAEWEQDCPHVSSALSLAGNPIAA